VSVGPAVRIEDKPRAVKVGVVPCNGEAMCEGTITRYACRRVLDQLRAGQTVTLCLPLFVAGDEKEKAFATRFPTITVDGCDKRCAALSTERLSGAPARTIVVSEVLADKGIRVAESPRQMGDQELAAVDVVAEEICRAVDEILREGEGD
jgi:uncharacterized metal-binding protein